jgi:hypothetical protein
MCIGYSNMTTTGNSNASTVTTRFVVDGVEVKKGTKWVFDSDGREYEVIGVGRKYLFTNGDPDTLYLAVNDVNDPNGRFIVTHKRFADEAKAEKPLVERLITVGQILNAGPCIDGVRALARILGMPDAHKVEDERIVFRLMQHVRPSGLNIGYSVNNLYEGYNQVFGDVAPTSWLLFIAKALNLVPKGMSQMDRKTLLRLLGIKP